MSLPGRSRPNVAVLTRTSPYAAQTVAVTGVVGLGLFTSGFPSSAPRPPTVLVVPPAAPHPGWRNPSNTIIVNSPVEVGSGSPLRGTTWLGSTLTARSKKIAVTGGTLAVGLVGRASKPNSVVAGTLAVGLIGSAAAVKAAAVVGRLGVGLWLRNTVTTPAHFTYVLITRDYDLATGDAPTGVVYFTPSAWLLNNGVTVPAARVSAALDAVGQISISLVANDDPDTNPEGSFYQVREVIVGQPPRTYNVVIPYNSGASVDLATLPVLA